MLFSLRFIVEINMLTKPKNAGLHQKQSDSKLQKQLTQNMGLIQELVAEINDEAIEYYPELKKTCD